MRTTRRSRLLRRALLILFVLLAFPIGAAVPQTRLTLADTSPAVKNVFYVTERWDHAIAKVTEYSDGTHVTDNNFFTALPASGPDSVIFDHHGKMLVSNYDDGSIWMIDTAGPTVLQKYQGMRGVADMALDPLSDTVVAIQWSGNQVYRVNLQTGAVTSLCPCINANGDGSIYGFGGVAFDGRGRLFVSSHNGYIYELDPKTGQVIRSLFNDYGMDGMTFDPVSGHIFASDCGGICEFSITSGDSKLDISQLKSYTSTDGDGIAADGQGHILVVSGTQLLRLDLATDTTTSIATGINSADDVAPVVGSGAPPPPSISLSPVSATIPAGGSTTLTATVADGYGKPLSGVKVNFTVVSGPDARRFGEATTNGNGLAQFTLRNQGGSGTDAVQASFIDVTGTSRTSNQSIIRVTGVIKPLVTSVTADVPVVGPGGADGYTITVRNPNPVLVTTAAVTTGSVTVALQGVTMTSITDTLPAGFSYVPGSTTSKIVMGNPSISGQTLSWKGPFFVPNSGSIALHFKVRAATVPGDYFDQAGGTANETRVTPSGLTARIRVLAPLVSALTADSPTTIPGGTDGYTITISNPNPSAMTVTSIAQALPAGFIAIPSTVSGVTTNDPGVAGSTLTWSGSFVVPAGKSISVHVRVQVSSTPGMYSSQVSGAAIGDAVTPSGATAKITVGGASRTLPFTGGYSGTYAVTPYGTGCPPYCTVTGAGSGSGLWLLGSKLSLQETADYSGSPGNVCAQVHGTMTLVANTDGSALTLVYLGTSCFAPGNVYAHQEKGTFQVTAGTGRFLGAGGSGRYLGGRLCSATTCHVNDPLHAFQLNFSNASLTLPA